MEYRDGIHLESRDAGLNVVFTHRPAWTGLVPEAFCLIVLPRSHTTAGANVRTVHDRLRGPETGKEPGPRQ